jgi:F0F1-type ATP synthase membrane subunit b/b'
MFQFNLTLWVIFVSFAIFMALMKVLFFDKIAWVKQQREQKLAQLQEQANACVLESQTLEATYQQELSLIRQEASKLFESKVKQAQAEHAALLASAKANLDTALQQHQGLLQAWQFSTKEELGAYQQTLEASVLKQLHLSELTVVEYV